MKYYTTSLVLSVATAVCLQLCSGAKPKPTCDYGTTPGTFESIGNQTWTWRSFDRNCPLRNELTAVAAVACLLPEHCSKPDGVFSPLRAAWNFTNASAQADATLRLAERPAKILVVGDSLDRYFGYDLCGLAGYNVLPFVSADLPACTFHTDRGQNFHDCMTCKMPGFIYSKEAAFSVHMSGPLERGLAGFADERALKALAQFTTEFGAPELIVLSSNLWDIGRYQNIDLNGNLDDMPEMLPLAWLDGWIANMSRVVEALQEVTGTTIVIRTPVPPASNLTQNSKLIYGKLGYQAHYAQLTQASHQVAHLHGLQVVDMYSKLRMMNDPAKNLRDGVHAAWWVGMEVINMYLNIIAEQRLRPSTHSIHARRHGASTQAFS